VRRFHHAIVNITKKPLSHNAAAACCQIAARIIAIVLLSVAFAIAAPLGALGLAFKCLAVCLYPKPVPLPSSPPPPPPPPPPSPPIIPPQNSNNIMTAPVLPKIPQKPINPPVIPAKKTTVQANAHLAKENDFFNPIDGGFYTSGRINQCGSQGQFDNAVVVCLHAFSLTESEVEQAIMEEVLKTYDFSKMPLKHPAGLSDYIVNIAIQAFEIVLDKKFNENSENAYAITVEMMRRIDNVWFHGTNLPALDGAEGIKQHGLSRVKRPYDMTIIKEIDAIGKKIITTPVPGKIFKFFNGQTTSTDITQQSCIYVTPAATTGLYFGERSPELFASFFESITQQHPTKTPFFAENRNEKEAMNAVETRLVREVEVNKTITTKEADKVRAFAKEYWKKYGDPTGVVLIVKKNTPNPILWSKHQTIKTCKDKLMERFDALHIDRVEDWGEKITNCDFPPENITCFRIPFVRIKGNGEYDAYNLVK